MVSGSPTIASFAKAGRRQSQLLQTSTPMLASSDIVSITFEEQQEKPTDNCLGDEKTQNAHRFNQILPISTRRQIVLMQDTVLKSGKKLLVSKKVEQFPDFFKGSESVNFMRARSLWGDCTSIMKSVTPLTLQIPANLSDSCNKSWTAEHTVEGLSWTWM